MNTAMFLKNAIEYYVLASGALRVTVNGVPVKDIGYYEKAKFLRDAKELGITLRKVEPPEARPFWDDDIPF